MEKVGKGREKCRRSVMSRVSQNTYKWKNCTYERINFSCLSFQTKFLNSPNYLNYKQLFSKGEIHEYYHKNEENIRQKNLWMLERYFSPRALRKAKDVNIIVVQVSRVKKRIIKQFSESIFETLIIIVYLINCFI